MKKLSLILLACLLVISCKKQPTAVAKTATTPPSTSSTIVASDLVGHWICDSTANWNNGSHVSSNNYSVLSPTSFMDLTLTTYTFYATNPANQYTETCTLYNSGPIVKPWYIYSQTTPYAATTLTTGGYYNGPIVYLSVSSLILGSVAPGPKQGMYEYFHK